MVRQGYDLGGDKLCHAVAWGAWLQLSCETSPQPLPFLSGGRVLLDGPHMLRSPLSPDKETLVDFPWAHASGQMMDNITDTAISGELFIGLTGVVRDVKTYNKQTGTTHNRYFEGYFAFTKKDRDCVASFCEGCRSAAQDCISTVVLALLFSIPTLISDITRTSVSEDSNLEKVIGFAAGILGGVIDLMGLIFFAQDCVHVLPEHIVVGDKGLSAKVEWEEGIGLKCLIAATCILILDGILHLVVPAPQLEVDEEGNVLEKYDIDENGRALKENEYTDVLADIGIMEEGHTEEEKTPLKSSTSNTKPAD